MKKILVVAIILLLFNTVYATSFIDSVFGQASGFFNPSKPVTSDGVGKELSDLLQSSGGIIALIKAVGNLIIIIAVVFLGLKYIYSSIEGKTNIKETLPNFIVGVIFFYLATEITTFGKSIGVAMLGDGTSFSQVESNVYTTVKTIANTFAIIGIVLVGIKYLITSSDEKANVKKQLIPMVVGIILVYSSINFINFVIAVGQGIIV